MTKANVFSIIVLSVSIIIAMVLYLTIFWFLLSGRLSAFFIILAFLSVLITSFVDKKLSRHNNWILGFKISWIVFVLNIIKESFVSAIHVTKIIWFSPEAVSSQIFWLTMNLKHRVNIITFANAVTLTPGTMTLDIKDNQILVHCLTHSMNLNQIKNLVKKVDV